MKKSLTTNSRRNFISTPAAGPATAAGISTIGFAKPRLLVAANGSDAEAWFKNAKGKHRIVYDASEPHAGLPFIWSWVFYQTNNETGVADKDMTAMVVLRHNAMPFALVVRLWKKYNLGEVFILIDNKTKKPSLRNLYYQPGDGDFPASNIDGIQKMQDRGAMFCVCNMALKVYAGIVAGATNLNAEEVYQDWKSGVLKGIQIVPSGVWAVGRSQEHGFAYCYAGG